MPKILADTRHMPLETAAAVYEANAADADYMRSTFMGNWLPLNATNPTWAYRAAAERVMSTGFEALRVAESLGEALAAATDRVRSVQLPGIPRAALDSLTGIYMALMDPAYSLDEPAPLHLITALEDTCEQYGVIAAEERSTCHTHGKRAADCCA
ncbi:hypothetical protein ACWD1Y_11505 [Streptomyces sp. NPDC002814]